MNPNLLQRLKGKTRELRREIFAMYLAIRHPATPWYAKVLAATIVAYALSPFDLIPDPVPILGYLDDLVVVPLGVMAVRWMIPAAILTECRERALAGVTISPAWKWAGAMVISMLWLACAVAMIVWGWRRYAG